MIQDVDNGPRQVNNPPNHLMIKAANVILHQDSLLKQNHEVIFNLQRQLDELTQQYETLRTMHAATESSRTA